MANYTAIFEDGVTIEGEKLGEVVQKAMIRQRMTGKAFRIKNKEGKYI